MWYAMCVHMYVCVCSEAYVRTHMYVRAYGECVGVCIYVYILWK